MICYSGRRDGVNLNRCPPRQTPSAPTSPADGVDLRRAVELVEHRGAAAQLCVLRDGDVVLDRAVGAGPDTPFLLFSAGKPSR